MPPAWESKKEIPAEIHLFAVGPVAQEHSMSMSYQARQVGNVTVLDISGRLDIGVALAFGPGAGVPLQQVIRDFIQRGQKNIVLNLHDVSYIDSSGLGDLVGSATTLRKEGGDLKVVNPSLIVRKLLSTTRLDPLVIDVKPDEASALQAFAKTVAPGAA